MSHSMKYVVIALIILSYTPSTSAGYWCSADYDMNGTGSFSYPNHGWVYLQSHDEDTNYNEWCVASETYTGMPIGGVLYIDGWGAMDTDTITALADHVNHAKYYNGGNVYIRPDGFNGVYDDYSGRMSGIATPQVGAQYVSFSCGSDSRGGAATYMDSYMTVYVSPTPFDNYTISGNMECTDGVELYTYINDSYVYSGFNDTDFYSFGVVDGESYTLVFYPGLHSYVFTVDGSDINYDYDACIWVYGYTCGIDTIKLRDASSQLIGTEYQDGGYDTYEMQGISAGNDYTVSFYDMDSILCYEHAFTCTGEHVLVDYDRCNWVWPPSPWGTPYIIYLWSGYDYNVVVFKDEHGNFIENSQLAIYDKTDGQYLQRWTDARDGYVLLGAKFATDHDVILSLKTFDGVFTLDTTYPANGSASAGDEDITTTNWTIPIMYNLDLEPVDQSYKPLFDVFCTLSEYTPFDPLSFWGMDLSDNGYVPVTNCSGFAMCDIVAEKDGYTDYNVTALNWTTRSALIKDYRHNIVMEAE